jgi:hypothetical protein
MAVAPLLVEDSQLRFAADHLNELAAPETEIDLLIVLQHLRVVGVCELQCSVDIAL